MCFLDAKRSTEHGGVLPDSVVHEPEQHVILNAISLMLARS